MNIIVVILGVVLIILAGFAYMYSETEKDSALGGLIEDEETVRPLRGWAIPLLFGGIILIVVGAVLPGKDETKTTKTTSVVSA